MNHNKSNYNNRYDNDANIKENNKEENILTLSIFWYIAIKPQVQSFYYHNKIIARLKIARFISVYANIDLNRK
jgi:hypothetical protein